MQHVERWQALAQLESAGGNAASKCSSAAEHSARALSGCGQQLQPLAAAGRRFRGSPGGCDTRTSGQAPIAAGALFTSSLPLAWGLTLPLCCRLYRFLYCRSTCPLTCACARPAPSAAASPRHRWGTPVPAVECGKRLLSPSVHLLLTPPAAVSPALPPALPRPPAPAFPDCRPTPRRRRRQRRRVPSRSASLPSRHERRRQR